MTTQSITSGQKKRHLRFVEDAAERVSIRMGSSGSSRRAVSSSATRGSDRQIRGVQPVRRGGGRVQLSVRCRIPRCQANCGSGPDSACGLRAGRLLRRDVGREALARAHGRAFRHPVLAVHCLDLRRGGREGHVTAIAVQRPFYNYRQGELGPQHLRETARNLFGIPRSG